MCRNLLIIDDRMALCSSLAQNFAHLGFKCHIATDCSSAISAFLRNDISVVLLDVRLGKEDGLNLLKQLKSLKEKVPIIMITGYANIESAVDSIKNRAFDYIQKPINFEKLVKIVTNAIEFYELKKENEKLKNQLFDFSTRIITNNKKFLDVCINAKKIALTNLPVLIFGESGTGKELLADIIHAHSKYSNNKIIKINCSSFTETLLENELFGHEKDAYTGASSLYRGVFEQSNNSTLFLDEIGDMPVSIQAKILRTIQNNEIRRLGSNRDIQLTIRFISATNKDLIQLIGEKKFREDLFYRLNVSSLTIPPLRDRKEDIPLLIKHFLHIFVSSNSTSPKYFNQEVMDLLLEYHWPGNVRELKNVVNCASALSNNDIIAIDDLPPYLLKNRSHASTINIREKAERDLIINILEKTSYNKRKAAEILKMSRKTLYNKMEKYDLSLK